MGAGPKVIDLTDAATKEVWSSKVSSHAIWKSLFLNDSWGFYGKEADSKMICEADNAYGITATLTMTGQMTGDGTIDGAPVEGQGEDFPHWNHQFDIHMLTSSSFEEKSEYEEQKVEWDVASRGRRAVTEWWNPIFNTGFTLQGCGWNSATAHAYFKPNGRQIVGSGAGNQYCGLNTVNTANLNDGGTNARVYRPNGRTNDQTLVAGDEMSVDVVDHMAAVIPQLTYPFRDVRWAGGESLLWFIHTDQLHDLQRDSRFMAIEDAIIMGGGDYADSTYAKNGARPYKGFTFIVTNWMPPGINSSTSVGVDNTRRSMICGAGAFAMRFGVGHGVNRLSTSMGKSNKGGRFWCLARCTFGISRVDYNSMAYATYVVPTYAVNRGDQQ